MKKQELINKLWQVISGRQAIGFPDDPVIKKILDIIDLLKEGYYKDNQVVLYHNLKAINLPILDRIAEEVKEGKYKIND